MRQQRERKPFGPRREKPEFDQKVLDIRRTARVVAGGRRFTFRATVVIGDHNGRVGVGVGKGVDVSSAVEKGAFQAKKNKITIPITDTKTIPFEVEAKFSAARVLLKPAKEGKGLVAGGSIRAVAAMAGIKNLTGKILSRTPNKLNNAQATMVALRKLRAR
jgi:small subunit ribosomal protein S5